MAEIWLWNSIAKRRRSISDTFYDNGLGTLKGYLEKRGHSVEVVDWARDDFFQGLTPLPLARLLRRIYSLLVIARESEALSCHPEPRLWRGEGSKKRILRRLRRLRMTVSRVFAMTRCLGFISIQLQELMSAIQSRRLKKHIKKLAADIKKRNVRIVGVKIWYGDAFKNAQYLANVLKRIAPEIILIAGGYHVTLYEENVLKFSAFDLGVVCEGEFALEAILGTVDKYRGNWDKHQVLKEIIDLAETGKIENLIYRRPSSLRGAAGDEAILKTKRKIDLASTSKTIPNYEFNPNKVKIHVMVESLGCTWGRCSFCVHPQFYPHYLLRDVESIVTQTKELLKFGIGIFRFAGSDTPPNVGARIAQRFIDEKLNVIFGVGSRATRGAEKNYDHLVDSYTMLIKGGLRSVFMGGESGNDFINQEVMNKGVTFQDIVFTVKALREAERIAGEKVYLSFALIFPTPLLGKVTLKEVEEDNLRLLRQIMPDSVMITPPGPFLHTKWNEEREKFGFGLEEGLIKQAMEYEYVLYKPPHLWPKLGISLEGRPFKQLLAECEKFRERVEKELDIPTDISDEHFLMFYAAGIREKMYLKKLKLETMLDIVSCDYTKTVELSKKINQYSEELAKANVHR